MPIPVSRIALLTFTALFAAPVLSHANTAGPYLNWQNKPQAQQPSPQAYNVPASPYGQVGDPYNHTLNWPAKQSTRSAPQQQAPQPVPQPRQASVAPLPRQPILQQPLAQQPVAAPVPMASVAVPQSVPQPKPIVMPPIPASDPEDEDAPPPAAGSSYQVPATSKYAARIAAARALQAQQAAAEAATPPQDAASPAGGAAPVAPQATTSLASQETDHVFIPGEQITDTVSQEPRRYSLHRQYGLHPDPIQVDHDATGALLETHFDAVESNDDDDKTATQESGSDDGQTSQP